MLAALGYLFNTEQSRPAFGATTWYKSRNWQRNRLTLSIILSRPCLVSAQSSWYHWCIHFFPIHPWSHLVRNLGSQWPYMLGTVLNYACCPNVIINRAHFHFQTHPSLNNKLYCHRPMTKSWSNYRSYHFAWYYVNGNSYMWILLATFAQWNHIEQGDCFGIHIGHHAKRGLPVLTVLSDRIFLKQSFLTSWDYKSPLSRTLDVSQICDIWRRLFQLGS